MQLPIVIAAVLALVCLLLSFRSSWHKRLIDDLPTSKALGVFIGPAEVKGTAESEAPLTSHLAGVACVYHSWRIDEHWTRTVTETYVDAKGHAQTRTRQESGWTTVAQGGQSPPFYLKDDTGVIRIQPEGAKIEATEVFDRTVSRSDPLYYGKGPANEIPNSARRRRFCEHAIRLHTPLYVFGQARERTDVVAAEVARSEDTPIFVVSTRTEKQISSGYGWLAFMWLAVGSIATTGGLLVVDLMDQFGTIGWQPYAIALGGYAVAMGVGWLWMVYNSLVGLRQRVRQAWAQVDVQLKRRHDLIPALAQIAEGYRAHESGAQGLVATLRSQVESPSSPGGTGLQSITPALRTVIESYPDLKASEQMLKLQQSLADTEQRIALARDYFNNIASFYNARLETVPDRFAAALTGFKPQPLFGATDLERAPVRVSLAA